MSQQGMASVGHGWCVECGDIGDEDLQKHFEEHHSQQPDWRELVMAALEDVKNRLEAIRLVVAVHRDE